KKIKKTREHTSKIVNELHKEQLIMVESQGRQKILLISKFGKLIIGLGNSYTFKTIKKAILDLDVYNMQKTDKLLNDVAIKIGEDPQDTAFRKLFYTALAEFGYGFLENFSLNPHKKWSDEELRRIMDGTYV
ncbi:hypothetical protein HY640_03165, partial [Candidatus Woesearchaeota archaeon]|nr:hypothetical protein [Candidatus Woesearchaeota archaeon]